ncbi:MAG: TetR/AcrR family transcriptional regulator [Solirubrobacterales bacterium]
MPKIIPDTEGRILKAAKELFLKYTYRDIEMKEIAKEAGIAVGTLYNYFSNKKELYYQIFEESWHSTYINLEKVVNQDIDPVEKFKQYMTMTYDEIEKNGRLGIELVHSSQIDNPARPREFFAKNKIIVMLCECIEAVREKHPLRLDKSMDVRFAETCVLMVIDSLLIHPDEKEKNIEYITKVIRYIAE